MQPGVAHASFFDWTPDSIIRQMMDVNFFGLVNVTRALLPMLKRCERSRIINLSSIAGFACGFAGMSGYYGEYNNHDAYIHTYIHTHNFKPTISIGFYKPL
jgi:NADP-dependent 3-hydroxy acid dehydrogenase YdfG